MKISEVIKKKGDHVVTIDRDCCTSW